MLVSKNENIRFVTDILMKVGVAREDSQIVAESLTIANLRGIDSHGIMRLPVYVKRLQLGLIENKANTIITREDDVSAIIDGGNYIGQVVSRDGIKKAIEKASKNTLGLVLVCNSNHFGVASEYSMMAAEAGMIGIAASNTTPLMPPTGGREKMLGNNPLAISFPAGKFGMVTLDMAMSSVALGKVLNANLNNQEIPVGWGVDKDGNNTTNPKDIINGGFLLPVGGPKGYGLALVIEVVTAVLTNSAVSKEVKSIYQFKEKSGISHMFMAINIKSFIQLENYNERIETLLKYIKECPTVYNIEKIYLPGEIEDNYYRERLTKGVFINEELSKELNDLATELGVKLLEGK